MSEEVKVNEDTAQSACNGLLAGNGNNKFFIKVMCRYNVDNDEWLDLLVAINTFLSHYRSGMYSNVEAHLTEIS